MNIHNPSGFVLGLITTIVVFTTSTVLSWVGYMASDDMMYTFAASSWMNDFPHVGENHWSLRHTVTIPTALSFYFFGANEFSLVLVTTLYYAVLLIVSYYFIHHYFGLKQSVMTMLIVCTTPLLAVQSTIAGADLVETFFVVSSVLMYINGVNKHDKGSFFYAGILAGFAWVTRETSGTLLLLYGLLFVFYKRVSKEWYINLALGFICISGIEYLYLYTNTGDIIYKLWIDIDQGQSDLNRVSEMGGIDTGNIELIPILDPLISLLANQEFMMLYYFVPPAMWWVYKDKELQTEKREILTIISLLLILWVVSMSYVLPIRKLPRYYSVSTFCAAILVGLWISEGLLLRNRIKTGAVALVLLGSSYAVGIYVENKDPIFGEKTLVKWVKAHSTLLYTDPYTYTSAFFLLKSKGLTEYISKEKPPINALYFYNPNKVWRQNMKRSYSDEYQPKKEWVREISFSSNVRWIKPIVDALGIKNIVPDIIYSKLVKPNKDVYIYRVTK